MPCSDHRMVRRRPGVSLIEILLALSFMALLLLPMFRMITGFSGDARKQKAEGVAAGLAKEEMNWWLKQAPDSFLATCDHAGWNFRQTSLTIEGNIFELGMKVRHHPGPALVMEYPEFVWHDFVNGGGGFGPCVNGVEQRPLTAGSEVLLRRERLGDISTDRANRTGFYDLLLRVRWRLPHQPDYPEENRRFLVTRRAIQP